MKETPAVAPYFNIYRPADLSVTGQPLPVIAWANGGCVRGDDSWISMFERWAQSGIVVLTLTAGGPLTLFDQSTTDDHLALVAWAVSENQKQGSPYFGKLDTHHIATAGNSCGGVTALQAAGKNKDIAAVFVLSGSSGLPGTSDDEIKSVVTSIEGPVVYIEGSSEDLSRENAEHDYELYAEGDPVAIISRSTGDHETLSTDAGVLKDASEFALNWFDLAFWGSTAALDVLSSPTVCETCMPGVWTLKSKSLETLVK